MIVPFRQFLEEAEVAANRRQGITHFQQMKPEEFVLWMRSVKQETDGVLKNIKAVMKIDGLGARFGKDANGRPFFEGSRTGPVFDSGAFGAYARSKTDDVEVIGRAVHYDNMLEIFKTAPFMQAIPNDTKVICEIFYNPMSKEHPSGGVIFVHVAYDKNKLGSEMSIMPYTVVVASTGQEHPDKKNILDTLYSKSSARIKIIDPNLKFNTIDVSMFTEPATLIDDESLSVLKSRKPADRVIKQNLLNLIQKLKDDLADYLLKHPGIEGKFKLGPDIEGVVLHLPQSTGTGVFKITTPEFKSSLKEQAFPPRAASENELFLGRMQPLHKGHQKIIKGMKNGIVVVVKGKASSEDKARNPLDIETQQRLLAKAVPGVPVSVSPNGFLPGILGYFRKQGKEIVKIYCGADRIADYSKAISDANKKMAPEYHYQVEFEETERFTSATSVRKAIRTGDYDTFKTLMPREIWDEWDNLRAVLTVNEEVVATTVSANVEKKDNPLFVKPIKRKQVPSYRTQLNNK